ncbi:MAG: C40 family peptidase [Atopobiaceae bacterium]|nr:C40 family peptidase [Atopobiaceae bacterium]
MLLRGRVLVSAGLALALGLGGVPVAAFAEETTSVSQPATLDEAWATYGELSLQVAEVGESLNDTYYRLQLSEENKASLTKQIEESEAQLAVARQVLGDRVAANYKAGASSLLDIILGTESFEGLVAALHYVDKLTSADIAVVDEVTTLTNQLNAEKTDLEKTEKDLKELAGQKEQQLKDLQASIEQQKGYIAGLSAPMRAAFDERQVSEIVEQQAKAVEALAAQEALLAASDDSSSQQAATTPESANAASTAASVAASAATQSETSSAAPAQDATPSPAPSASDVAAAVAESADASSESASDGASSTSTLSSDARAKILEAAYSQIGVQYVYGASSPGEAFDCSGLTSWAYEQAGIEIPHSSVAQAEMATNVSSADDLQAGDLVFYIGNVGASQSGSHVAIYAGDGQVIHANGSEVVVSEMNDSWTSAGSIGMDDYE